MTLLDQMNELMTLKSPKPIALCKLTGRSFDYIPMNGGYICSECGELLVSA